MTVFMNQQTINSWYTAGALQSFLKESEEAQKKKKRFCYKQLMGFLLTKGKDICALYGIRRTGKTVLMLQAMTELMGTYHIPAENIAYITVGEKNDLDDEILVQQIMNLGENGVRYVFVDEISFIQMELEENSLNLLADRLAKSGMKIVIAGTFSYAIRLLAKESLFDRMQQIDTSYFSFKEAHEIFGQDLDTFLKYGGVINFEDNDSVTPADYMETAVVQNIVKSIFKSNRKYDLLMTIPDRMKQGKSEKELQVIVAGLIRIAIDNYMKVLVVGKLANRSIYRYSDVGKLANVIRQRSEAENEIDESLEIISLDAGVYYRFLSEYLGNSKDIPEDTFKFIIKILEEMKIKQEIFLESGNVSVFVPNYLRYGLCDRIMKSINELVREETSARYDAKLAGEVLLGSIQEAVCYLDLKTANHLDFDMYRSADGSCEVDLIIRDKEAGWMDVYEIKHSSQVVPEQVKHLVNREFIREVEQSNGCKVRGYYVLYNGAEQTQMVNPVDIFETLEQKCLETGKTGNASKWERLKKTAAVQKWDVVEIQYKNMEAFLCELPIVR